MSNLLLHHSCHSNHHCANVIFCSTNNQTTITSSVISALATALEILQIFGVIFFTYKQHSRFKQQLQNANAAREMVPQRMNNRVTNHIFTNPVHQKVMQGSIVVQREREDYISGKRELDASDRDSYADRHNCNYGSCGKCIEH